MQPSFQSLRRTIRTLLRRPARTGGPSPADQPSRPDARPPSGRHGTSNGTARDGVPPPAGSRAYPGDATRLPDAPYGPRVDGEPDPGEIVWTWVPFEEDHTVGKDRPVLVVGHEGDWLVAMSMTSRDHDRDESQERAAGREWVDIGTGPWDNRGRASEVRVNRLLRLDPAAVRREGAVLDKDRYAAVIRAARRMH